MKFVDWKKGKKVFSYFFIRNHFINLGKDFLHRFKHYPIACNVLRLPVFLLDGIEALGLSFGDQNGFFGITLGNIDDLFGFSAGLGD